MKKGFSLAEVLVAFAIVGFIAGISIPIVNSVRPNEEMIRFKKAYYKLNQVVSDLINDDELYPSGDEPATFANTEAVPFRGETYGGATKFRKLVAVKMGGTVANDGTFIDRDNMKWTIPEGAGGTVTVDVNANHTGCRDVQNGTCDKPDIFNINVYSNGGMEPLGFLAPQYLHCNNNAKKAKKFGYKKKPLANFNENSQAERSNERLNEAPAELQNGSNVPVSAFGN